ncbi:RrF2 family transcriptional regulator [Clostridium saccharoperbutylacetonicum]|jgi:Rrf2 family protein|uniref:HTH-type transcriptional regulator CymR n=1 Tax=Clostridium saccharoperbutylacetonicum N1-4(HMT) TaxID=931276 RepID=M1MF51_9CLOT|nr:RrF2 family transcriptional regulator [Clostridium saccharoperbutylacetonicum]AGF55008.1 HTH-type transcriptional regulator CymR [Clostridium saccharoperbutylacetonicum N1-4(HMT)]NRT64283.1 Rrf2 family protein [Clostridium saccharoperbutylacetonicum]NSB27652.1 Rrf2 family protein [Clostridium saccharoperbutylacetonicum]NSB41139.1 Rrf2 family protein [Clostridium saccharoperbutylacetonicum]
MKLSTKGRYGVRAMVELAANYGGAPVSIKTISKKENLSEYYLEQLFSPLRRANVIRSIRGAQGGYVLCKPPREITVGDIMTILEGPVEIADCIDGVECDSSDCCATKAVWEKIKNSIDSVMNSITLQDILDDHEALQKKNSGIKIADRSE